jgi:hypothetical protein
MSVSERLITFMRRYVDMPSRVHCGSTNQPINQSINHDCHIQLITSLGQNDLWISCPRDERLIAKESIHEYLLSSLQDVIFGLPCDRAADRECAAKIAKLWFVRPEHLDIWSNDWEDSVWETTKQGMSEILSVRSGNCVDFLAHSLCRPLELTAMNSRKFPRAKLESLLNCCKAIICMHTRLLSHVIMRRVLILTSSRSIVISFVE